MGGGNQTSIQAHLNIYRAEHKYHITNASYSYLHYSDRYDYLYIIRYIYTGNSAAITKNKLNI